MAETNRPRSQWFCQHNGRIIGPLSSDELRKGVERGHVTPDSLVRKGADGEWLKASRVKGLFDSRASSFAGGSSGFPAAEASGAGASSRYSNQPPSNPLFDDMLIELAAAAPAVTTPMPRPGASARRYGKSRNPWKGVIIGGVVVVALVAVIGGIALAVKLVQGVSRSPEERIEIAKASTAVVKGEFASAAGVVVSPGKLLTTARITREGFMSMLSVHFPSAPSGQRGPFDVDIIYVDTKRDLAVLSISSDATPVDIASSFDPVEKSPAILVGNAGNEDEENEIARGTFGKSSESAYRISIQTGSRRSGAPILNESGELVGVVKSGSATNVTTLDNLSAVVESAEGATSSEISKAQTGHRLNAGFALQLMMSELYSQIGAGYAQFVAAASRDNVNAAAATRIFQSQLAASFKKLDEKLPPDVIATEMQTLCDDSNLPDGARGDLARVWENNQALRRLFETAGANTPDSVNQSRDLIAANRSLIDNIKTALTNSEFKLDPSALSGLSR